MNGRQFSSVEAIMAFALAGNARITLVSKETGIRFTYRIRQPNPSKPHFVGVLTGSDNEKDFSYLGTIFDGKNYAHGRKSHLLPSAPSAMAWQWFWSNMMANHLPSTLEVWHEGRCGRCARPLTVPSSIELGLGPECASKAA